MAARKNQVRYAINKSGEVIQAAVVPLPETTSPNGPTPREAARRNTVSAQAEVNADRRMEALKKRLDDRREARAEERRVAIAAAAVAAGDPDDDVALKRLRLGDIVVPEEFQRLLNEDRAIGYALKFSWAAFQAISVSKLPDGTLLLTDGQHRLYAAQLAYGDDVLVKCVVTTLKNIHQAAALFITTNDERVGLNYNAKFKARIVAQDDNVRQIIALLKEFDLDYTRPGEPRGRQGTVTAVSTLESMIRQAGVTSAREALAVLHHVWGDNPDAYRDFLLAGMWQFLIRYDGLYRRDRLIESLKRDGLEKIADLVPDFKTSVNSSNAAAACGAIHFTYNWHLRERDALPAFASEAKNRYAALIRRAARNWQVRHEVGNGGKAPARPITGMYAPGSQVPSTLYRRAEGLPDA